MADPVDFFGPDLKTERAEHHLRELDRIFGEYVRKNRNAAWGKAQKYNRHRATKIGVGFPRHTPTVIGDVIHNLRASLDHAYGILVEANGHTVTRHSTFPFGGDRNSVKGTIKGQMDNGNGPSEAVRDTILDDIQPFPGGKGERLYGVHKLDITDKHKVLIPTVPTMTLGEGTLTYPDGHKTRFTGEMTLIGIGADIKEKGFLTVAAGSRFELDNKAKATFDICFEREQPFEGENILQTLRDLLVLTRSALTLLQASA